MYPVSDEFKVAVRYSHQAIVKAEVLRAGQIIGTIYPESGSVEVDARRAQRRTCSVMLHSAEPAVTYAPTYNTYAVLKTGFATYATLAAQAPNYAATQSVTGQTATYVDDGLIPSSGLSLLTPFGNELRLYRGIRYRKQLDYTYATLISEYATYTALKNGVPNYGTLAQRQGPIATVDELVPLGVFPMTEVQITQDETGIQLDVSGTDRSLIVSDARWVEPYQIASGTNVGTALADLLQDRYPDVQLRFTETTATTAAIVLGVDTDNDPWADAVQIAEAAALRLYFDAEGYCVLEPAPEVSQAAAVEVYKENDEAMVLNTSRSISRDGVYNAVVVTGEGSGLLIPFRSVIYDDDPASPTYTDGPFGLKPTFRSSPLLTSQAAADAYALSVLNEIKGTQEELSWTQIVDPSLDAGDVVSVINPSAKIARAIILDRITIPLDPAETMSAQGRTIVYLVGDTVVTAGGEVVSVVGDSGGVRTSGNLVDGPIRVVGL